YLFLFFFSPPVSSEFYTLSLHDALPILKFPVLYLFPGGCDLLCYGGNVGRCNNYLFLAVVFLFIRFYKIKLSTYGLPVFLLIMRSEEHTLNSSHVKISYAVFCLKKKKNT